jgi:hypothetical protein
LEEIIGLDYRLRSRITDSRIIEDECCSRVSVDFTVSQVLLCLRNGRSSGTIKEGELPPLEAGTKGLVKAEQTKGTQCVQYWTFECINLAIGLD